MWGSKLSKGQKNAFLVVFVALLLSVGGFSAYLLNEYPTRVQGIYFNLEDDQYLDNYTISDVWGILNNSQIAGNYTVELVENSDDFWLRPLLQIIPKSEPHMRIYFGQDEYGDSMFHGNMRYEVQYPGLSDGYQEADQAMEREMSIILTAMGEPDLIQYYHSDDNDFAMIDNMIHSFLFFGGWALVIIYLFVMLYDGGKILGGYVGGEVTFSEFYGPPVMFIGIWMLFMVLYINIFKMLFMPAHAVCYTVGLVFVLMPVTIILMDRKQRQRNK